MKKNTENWFYPVLTKNSVNLVNRTIKSGYVNEGKVAVKLANKIAKICNRKYATTVSSGSTGLVCSLMAVGVKKDSIVILPAFSFIATANAITLIGAIPVFVDVDKETFCIDHLKLKEKINFLFSKKKKISAVVTVEVNGRSSNNFYIQTLCKKFKIPLITDSAEALGSTYYKKPLGGFGDLSVISLSPNKIITSAQGGIVMSNNKRLIKNVIAIKLHGNHIKGDGGADKFYRYGLNFKLSDLHAALALGQINEIKKRLNNVVKLNKEYEKYLSKYGFKFPDMVGEGKRLWIDCLVKNKKKAIKLLKEKKISYREFWHPLNQQKSYKNYQSKLANANFISQHGLWLASNFNLKVKNITDAFKKK